MFDQKRNIGTLKKVLSGFAILIPFLPLTALAIPARPNPKRNPCPKIYYEEPYNNKIIVPAGCTPNAATTRWKQTGQAVDQSLNAIPPVTNVKPIQPPIPENRASAVATIKPMMGKVSVTLKNDTNARISYQVLTHTEVRYLEGGKEVVLRDIPAPATITMVREDKGLLRVMPMSGKEDGMLTVSLDEKTTPDNDQGVLRIQADGDVFLN
ncbi:hypothetical protein [Rivularia sp. UHCC 0363]|uniref:hypothetical protein n=1 Tax=Rivularia sp. UHCC 0363 TaxID=3110244 RepID=UPI002B20CD19|nr:hypothetical protein [Rivularia sp. UHCC 0363]MEA5598521.1 hypothetical protein [Rivularia sp. UHCC 0363]